MGIVIPYRWFNQHFLIWLHLHGVLGEKSQNSIVSIVFYCISEKRLPWLLESCIVIRQIIPGQEFFDNVVPNRLYFEMKPIVLSKSAGCTLFWHLKMPNFMKWRHFRGSVQLINYSNFRFFSVEWLKTCLSYPK